MRAPGRGGRDRAWELGPTDRAMTACEASSAPRGLPLGVCSTLWCSFTSKSNLQVCGLRKSVVISLSGSLALARLSLYFPLAFVHYYLRP